MAGGLQNVTVEQYEGRLAQCNSNLCGQRLGNRCAACGCFLSAKAWWKNERCEMGYWDAIGPSGV